VDGTEELAGKMLAHDPDLKDDLSTPYLKEGNFGTNALTELLQEIMVAGLPGKNLKVGDQWTYRTEHRTDLTVIELKFTYAGLEKHLGHDCARIEIDGNVTSSTNRGDLPPEMPIPKVHGQVTGSLWLDIKLEMLVERTTVEERQTVMQAPGPMTFSEKRTVTTKLIKVED